MTAAIAMGSTAKEVIWRMIGVALLLAMFAIDAGQCQQLVSPVPLQTNLEALANDVLGVRSMQVSGRGVVCVFARVGRMRIHGGYEKRDPLANRRLTKLNHFVW